MHSVVTIEERKRARVQQIRAGFARLCDALSDYGRAHGGRFWVYGSAAVDRFHYESDIDLLVDFPEPQTSAAITFVESTAAQLSLKADVQPKAWCTSEFVDRISKQARILP
jgi:predicted nucleotidyltransferase